MFCITTAVTMVLSVLLLGSCVSVEKYLGTQDGEGNGETHGLYGEYFSGQDLAGVSIDRIDPVINFQWTKAPMLGIPADHFSIRWSGWLQPPSSGQYTFTTVSSDGIRFHLNERLLIDQWKPDAAVHSARIFLEAGKRYPIQIEYLKSHGMGHVQVFWQRPDQQKELMPARFLHPKYTIQKGCTPEKAKGTVLGNVFIKDGYGTKWNYRVNKLAYMRHQPNGYYKIFLSDPDGRNEKSLTAGHPSLPKRHHGVPDWHPSGKYLVFVAEKPEHVESSAAALPGFGGYSDIWLITADGSKVWKLVELANRSNTGVLLPRFARDEKKMIWAERVEDGQLFNPLLLAGSYVIKVADFLESPDPHLENIRVYQPGGPGFYESSDFSPDGRFLLFTSNYETRNFWKNQIYRLDLETGKVLRLTEEDYNEHPAYTPNGKAIIYMSGYQTEFLFPARGTDWWLMNPDGTNRRRITFMNTRHHAQSMGGPLWAITAVAWSPDGEWFYGDVQSNLVTQRGDVIKVFLRCNGQ